MIGKKLTDNFNKQNNSLYESFQKLILENKLEFDYQQNILVKQLDNILTQINNLLNKKKNIFQIFFEDKYSLKGLYVYGPVGRGKTMIMDLFYDHINSTAKRKMHFHEFMQEIHKDLRGLRIISKENNSKLLPNLAKIIAKSIKILFIDELDITDITDAMIIGSLFEEMIKQGLIIIVTSNRAPKELYKDGLQREKFLDFIKIVENKMDIFTLESEQDYRLKKIKSENQIYFYPLTKENNYNIEKIFNNIITNQQVRPTKLEVFGREIVLNKTSEDVVFFDFDEICAQAFGANDYIAICNNFAIIFIINIPKFTWENNNETKRFITFVDEIYKYKAILICSAEDEPHKLCLTGKHEFEFKRTASRLAEMQSYEYINNSKMMIKK